MSYFPTFPELSTKTHQFKNSDLRPHVRIHMYTYTVFISPDSLPSYSPKFPSLNDYIIRGIMQQQSSQTEVQDADDLMQPMAHTSQHLHSGHRQYFV